MSWDTPLPAPIPVPGAKPPLVTLRDAATLIQELPRTQVDQPEWQAAIEALVLAAEDRGPLMHAQVGMMRALHPQEPVYDTSRKDPHWGRRKLVRDQ